MKYRTLGRTQLKVSQASLGTGGPSRLGQRTHADEAQSHRVVRRALELGINLFDSAANYSDSESILGRALSGVSRDSFLLATKFAPDPNEDGEIIRPEELVKSCELSLRRLQVESIDIFQFHGVLPGNYREVVERLYPTALKLQEQGKFRFLGITEYFYHDVEHQMLEQALTEDVWDTIMVKYGILNMLAEKRVLPLAQEKNVGVMNMSSVRVKMTQGEQLSQFLSTCKAQGKIPVDCLPDDNPLGFLVKGDIKSVVQAGYKFGVDHPAVDTLLFGTGSVEHLEENIQSIIGPRLPAEDTERLREIFGDLAESEMPSM